jgi:hypothetical protein
MTGALWLTGSIARPVRRLADAARAVRLAGGRRVPLPDMSKSAATRSVKWAAPSPP